MPVGAKLMTGALVNDRFYEWAYIAKRYVKVCYYSGGDCQGVLKEMHT